MLKVSFIKVYITFPLQRLNIGWKNEWTMKAQGWIRIVRKPSLTMDKPLEKECSPDLEDFYFNDMSKNEDHDPLRHNTHKDCQQLWPQNTVKSSVAPRFIKRYGNLDWRNAVHQLSCSPVLSHQWIYQAVTEKPRDSHYTFSARRFSSVIDTFCPNALRVWVPCGIRRWDGHFVGSLRSRG